VVVVGHEGLRPRRGARRSLLDDGFRRFPIGNVGTTYGSGLLDTANYARVRNVLLIRRRPQKSGQFGRPGTFVRTLSIIELSNVWPIEEKRLTGEAPSFLAVRGIVASEMEKRLFSLYMCVCVCVFGRKRTV